MQDKLHFCNHLKNRWKTMWLSYSMAREGLPEGEPQEMRMITVRDQRVHPG